MTISKANAFLAAASIALGVGLTGGRPAVAETMLDQFTVTSCKIREVNAAGACVIIVQVNSGASGASESRPVGDAKGGVKLYGSQAAADAIVKKMKLDAAVVVGFKRFEVAQKISDPIAELKALHKATVKELATFTAEKATQTAAMTVALGLHWDVAAVDTIQRQEYDNGVLTLASVSEVVDYNTTKKAEYQALLVAAHIDPVTYLPVV